MTTALSGLRKTLTLSGRVLKSDNATGAVTALVNTSAKDLQSDIMQAGCWRKVISEQQKPPVFWQHDTSQLPLGSVTGLQELAPGDYRIPSIAGKSSGTVGGLLAKMQFAVDTSRGHDAFVLVRDGHVKEWSVQVAIDPAKEEHNRQGARVVKEVHQLIELSMVVMGASLGTGTIEAKSAYDRLQSDRAGTISKVLQQAYQMAADKAEAQTFRALMGREREAARNHGTSVGVNVAVDYLADAIARMKQVKEIERMAGVAGNYFVSKPAQPMSQNIDVPVLGRPMSKHADGVL